MVIYIDLDSQDITDGPGISGARGSISLPRANAVPLIVQFSSGGVIVDPEEVPTKILTSTIGAGTVFTAPGHPFVAGDHISIANHGGLPIRISTSGASGENSQTVTMTSANPGVVTVSGYAANDEVVFSTTGVLPDNIVAGTRYFVIATGLTSSACQVSTTIGGAGINTTAGTQSGVHTAINLTRYLSTNKNRCLITTLANHGMTAGGNGTAADGSALAAGKFLVKISGHQTTKEVRGIVTSASLANPTLITTSLSHGLATGDLVTITGNSESTVNVTATVVVKSSTTFLFSGVNASSAGTGGSFLRPASNINGTHVATWVSATTFTIPLDNYSVLRNGTSKVTTTTPIANTVDDSITNDVFGGEYWTINSVTKDTFTVNLMTLTAAGEGGIASRSDGLDLRWTVKDDGKHDGAVVAYANNFEKSGSGTTTAFSGTCNYITTELNSLLGIDPVSSGSIVGISGSTWTSSAAHLLSAGDTIVFAATTIPGGVIADQTYYILTAPTTTTFTIAATAGGTVITPTSSGSVVTFDGYLNADDVEEATLMAELSWDGAMPSKTNWIRHYVRNDLYKGGDSDPVGVNGQDGSTPITASASEQLVTFSPQLSSANWHFLGAPYVENTAVGALGLSFMGLSTKTALGFTAILSGATDSGAYVLRWSVRPD